jgi:hypothetical protein
MAGEALTRSQHSSEGGTRQLKRGGRGLEATSCLNAGGPLTEFRVLAQLNASFWLRRFVSCDV